MVQEPLIGDVGVLAVVPDRWGDAWQSRHHILTRLSRFFHVVWIDPAPGLRFREWRGRAMRRNFSLEYATDAQSSPGAFTVLEPSMLSPSVRRPRFMRRMLGRPRLRQASRILSSRGCKRIILDIWRPEFADALDLVNHDLTCYHIDDEYSFSDTDLPLHKVEAQLIAKVDQVFVTSTGLLEKKGAINPHTSLVPNGVDYQAYANPLPEPLDLRPIPHPRIGYSGFIKRTLDLPLLEELSMRHLDWQFVFVGPWNRRQAGLVDVIRRLSKRRNVHFLGAKSVAAVAAYPQHFDVCIMPYRVDSHSMRYGYPLKLHEYLATGRPIVSTPLRSLLAFSHVVKLALTGEEWSRSITESLGAAAMDPWKIEARRAVAREHDWGILVELIAHTLCQRLGPSYLQRFPKLSPQGLPRQ